MSKRRDHLDLVLLSDTHGFHRDVTVPDGDLLIHAGDFTLFGHSEVAVRDFNDWLGELPHRHKIIVPGNHEFFLEADRSKRSFLSNATLLINEAVETAGLSIWGSPITPLYSGAFGLSSATDRQRAYAQIPDATDILITHTPPYGFLDTNSADGVHAGCRELFEALKRIQPMLHVFGHIHGAHGSRRVFRTTFANASLAGIDGGIAYEPIVVRFDRR